MDKTQVFELLHIGPHSGKLRLIGANRQQELRYLTDYDTELHAHVTEEERRPLVGEFQEIFRRVAETPDVYIGDFKAGLRLGQPVRWGPDEVAAGRQDIDGIDVELWSVLNTSETVKLDIIAWSPQAGLFLEFSCNYYFHGDSDDSGLSIYQVSKSLMVDVRRYFLEGNLMKMLKRLMSYRLLHGKGVRRFVNLFNGPAGLLYQAVHRLSVLESLYELDQAIDPGLVAAHYNKTMSAVDDSWVPVSEKPSPELLKALPGRLKRCIGALLEGSSLLNPKYRRMGSREKEAGLS